MQTPAETQAPEAQPARSKGAAHTIWSWLGALMFGGVLVALSVYTAPNLISDWQVRSSAMPYADARVTEGSCRSKLFVHICGATLAVNGKSGRFVRDVNYVFVDFHVGDYSVRVMADPARPEMLTTDLALDKLWSRTLTLLAGGGFLLVLALSPIVALIRRPRPG